MAVTRRALLGTQRAFDRDDVDGNGALSGVDRQHQAAAGDAAVDLDHQSSGARIVGIGIGRDRLRQRNVDFAHVIARDRLGLGVGEFAGIDRLLDCNHAGAAFPCAEADQDLIALRQRLVVQPENPGADPSCVARCCAGMRNDVAAFDEQFAVERDADRAAGAMAARKRCHRPAFHGLDLGNLAGRHDDDFVAGARPPDSMRPATIRRSSNL